MEETRKELLDTVKRIAGIEKTFDDLKNSFNAEMDLFHRQAELLFKKDKERDEHS